MANAAESVTSESLSDGWALLSDGDWEAAGRCFGKALDREETAEALEGLSWAAWWQDDPETVFDSRERAYLLYKQRGDPASAARMATWLAADQMDFHGARAVAGGWLQRARRLLEPTEPSPEHGWLAFHEGYIAHISGDPFRAAELAVEAADAGRRFGVHDLEMLGIALQGTVLVARTEVEEGMRLLDEATASALTDEVIIPISSAWTCCFMVGSCAATLDYPRAIEWCDRIAEFAERYGSRYMLAFCRAEYGAIYQWQGRWSDAESMLEDAVEDFSRSRPAMVGGPLVGLAELRRKQARFDEALQLLDRAGPSAGRLCRARIALDQGDARRAVELGERLLRQAPTERTLDSVPIYEHMVRAHLAVGELDGARVALESLRGIEALIGTEPLRASASLAEGLVEAAAGEHDRARALLEDAVDGFLRVDCPFEAARARVDLAETLIVLGRSELAEREARQALSQLLDLGAETEATRARRVIEYLPGEPGDVGARRGITEREREVLSLIAEGLTNRQIAEYLVVSEHTVHRHTTNILRKLNLSSRTAAATYALRSGILDGT